MNGKGDKWRGGWTEEFKNNYNNIFRKESKMKAISQALEDVRKYLEVGNVKNIKVNYGVNDDSYKDVQITFDDKDASYQVLVTKIGVRK